MTKMEKLYRPNKEKVEARQRSMYGEDFPTLSMGEKLARILARSSTEDLKGEILSVGMTLMVIITSVTMQMMAVSLRIQKRLAKGLPSNYFFLTWKQVRRELSGVRNRTASDMLAQMHISVSDEKILNGQDRGGHPEETLSRRSGNLNTESQLTGCSR